MADDHEKIERLARDLASLGAETPAERAVKRVAPWIISLAVHVGLISLALFITWTVRNLPEEQDAPLIVADFNALAYEPVARMSAAAEPASPSPAQDRVQSPPLATALSDRLSEGAADLDALMPGTGAGAAGPPGLAQFAPGATRIGATFVGVSSSNAKRIVYVIDASGSMVAYIQFVVQELSRSLDGLSPQQSFSVIFFQGNEAIEAPPAGKLIPATAQEKTRVMNWISGDNVVPRGGTNPVAAIEKALALKPDVIFLLSQDITGYGQFEVDQDDLLQRLSQLNPINPQTNRRATQINCIQFLDEDPLGTMAKIAELHGGPNGYKFLSRDDLGLKTP